MFKFSKNSLRKLMTCDIDIQKIMHAAIKVSAIDFGISFGHRTPEEQFELYKKGRKEVDGIFVITCGPLVVTYKDGDKHKSEHNYFPSRAIDIYPYFSKHKDETWNKLAFAYLAGLLDGISKDFYSRGITSKKLFWGANWDSDADFIFDHKFLDYPHFEIRN